ncbi:hypothetical protein K0M31_010562 [Melipona bicolor]|uniref:Uncharacterized protein n=1 Tax=Melipona bicolor TaxID=60889 RepID=A0AA40FLA3_9HYME|nr:hypothetical protein K0M31_010562 [Melipona bicolor]
MLHTVRVLSETENSQHLGRVTSFASLGTGYPLDNCGDIRGEGSFPATRERIYRNHRANEEGKGGCDGSDFFIRRARALHYVEHLLSIESGPAIHLRSLSKREMAKRAEEFLATSKGNRPGFETRADKAHSFGLS